VRGRNRERLAELQNAITAVTRAIAAAETDDITELVAERSAMRREVQALRQQAITNVVALDVKRRG